MPVDCTRYLHLVNRTSTIVSTAFTVHVSPAFAEMEQQPGCQNYALLYSMFIILGTFRVLIASGVHLPPPFPFLFGDTSAEFD